MNVFTIEKLNKKELAEGVKIRVVSGDNMTIVIFNLDPDAAVPKHSHPHEQIGTLLKGSLELTVDTTTQIVKPGDIYHIPSNMVHSGIALEATEIYEVFSPPRVDYIQL